MQMNYNITPRPPVVDYGGYQIDAVFNIFSNGKEIFTDSPSLRCSSTKEAMNIIDQSNKRKAAQDKQAALDKLRITMKIDSCELENGSQDAEDFANKVNDYYEQQLFADESR